MVLDTRITYPLDTSLLGKVRLKKNKRPRPMDLLASVAKLVGTEEASTDSKELLDVLLGKSNDGRTDLVLEATSRTALRSGDWLMIPPYKGKAIEEKVQIEL